MTISPLPLTYPHGPDEAGKYSSNFVISKENTFGYNGIVSFCSKILKLMLLIFVQ